MFEQYIEYINYLIFVTIFCNLCILIVLSLILFLFSKIKKLNRIKLKVPILVIMAIVVALTLKDVIPMSLDVYYKTIKIIPNVKYSRVYHSVRVQGALNDYIIITFPDENGIHLRFTEGGKEKTPFGDYSGTVVYAEHSKYMIDFIFNK